MGLATQPVYVANTGSAGDAVRKAPETLQAGTVLLRCLSSQNDGKNDQSAQGRLHQRLTCGQRLDDGIGMPRWQVGPPGPAQHAGLVRSPHE